MPISQVLDSRITKYPYSFDFHSLNPTDASLELVGPPGYLGNIIKDLCLFAPGHFRPLIGRTAASLLELLLDATRCLLEGIESDGRIPCHIPLGLTLSRLGVNIGVKKRDTVSEALKKLDQAGLVGRGQTVEDGDWLVKPGTSSQFIHGQGCLKYGTRFRLHFRPILQAYKSCSWHGEALAHRRGDQEHLTRYSALASSRASKAMPFKTPQKKSWKIIMPRNRADHSPGSSSSTNPTLSAMPQAAAMQTQRLQQILDKGGFLRKNAIEILASRFPSRLWAQAKANDISFAALRSVLYCMEDDGIAWMARPEAVLWARLFKRNQGAQYARDCLKKVLDSRFSERKGRLNKRRNEALRIEQVEVERIENQKQLMILGQQWASCPKALQDDLLLRLREYPGTKDSPDLAQFTAMDFPASMSHWVRDAVKGNFTVLDQLLEASRKITAEIPAQELDQEMLAFEQFRRAWPAMPMATRANIMALAWKDLDVSAQEILTQAGPRALAAPVFAVWKATKQSWQKLSREGS